MVCESCQKSLASFSTLISSWYIANGWNDEDMKEDFDDFEMVQVKKENADDFSDSNTNSSTGIIDTSDSAKAKSKNGQANIKVKTEHGGDISDSTSESVNVKGIDVKKEAIDEETGMDQDLQLKNEEIDIKPEDEDG